MTAADDLDDGGGPGGSLAGGDLDGKADQLETRSALAAQIEDQRRTVQQLEARMWGISLREMSNGKFVVLPRGTLEDSRWIVDGKPAVRLSSK